MKNFTILISVLVFCCLPVFSCTEHSEAPESQAVSESPAYLSVQTGIHEDGRPTDAWIEAIRNRHDPAALDSIADIRRPITAEERQWANLIEIKTAVWRGWIDSLSIPFKRIKPPDTTSIIMGNAGGNDAFTQAPATIGFDLSQLYSIYGSATTEENDDRIDRFFAHEMTHILHKVWDREHGIEPASPLEYALWDCLVEGLGNYRSLSSKWVNEDGVLTDRGEATLDALQPIFVERIAALAHANEEEAVSLLEGLSIGPFTKKWGALTTALWLAQEARGDDARLQRRVEAGPWGVLDLAGVYLPDSLNAKLAEVRGMR